MGRRFLSFMKKGKKNPITNPQNLQGNSFERASTDDLRADISKGHQSLLKTLAIKARGAGCKKVALANDPYRVGHVAERMIKTFFSLPVRFLSLPLLLPEPAELLTSLVLSVSWFFLFHGGSCFLH